MKHRPNKLDRFAGRLADWQAQGLTCDQMVKQINQEGCGSGAVVIAPPTGFVWARRRGAPGRTATTKSTRR